MSGRQRFAPAVDELADLDHEVAGGVKGAAVDGPEPDTTTLSQDPEVGEVDVIRGLSASQALSGHCGWRSCNR